MYSIKTITPMGCPHFSQKQTCVAMVFPILQGPNVPTSIVIPVNDVLVGTYFFCPHEKKQLINDTEYLYFFFFLKNATFCVG